jgi:hypothetical protein
MLAIAGYARAGYSRYGSAYAPGEMELRIAGDSFFAFHLGREVDAKLAHLSVQRFPTDASAS